MLRTGVDIIEISRIHAVLQRWGDRFKRRIFTEEELRYSKDRAPQLAARFAAKEATMKLLGTGIRGVGWKDIEVVRQRGMAPEIVLHSRAKVISDKLGVSEISLSISHSREYAISFVVGISER